MPNDSQCGEDCNSWLIEQNRYLSNSQENLFDPEANPQVFVALYDFQSGGENQLSIRKGEPSIVGFNGQQSHWLW